jgi:predicted RNA binding protein YcfA (HicA-like mRNA interferase family)
MSQWGSKKARLVFAALLRIGWQIKRQSVGSHRVLARPGWADFVFAFHDGEEIGPRMQA